MIAARGESSKMLMTAQHSASACRESHEARNHFGRPSAKSIMPTSWMLRRAATPTRPGFILKGEDHQRHSHHLSAIRFILDLTLWFHGQSQTDLGHRRSALRPGTQTRRIQHLGRRNPAGDERQKGIRLESICPFRGSATLVLE